jgi:hypothetical protein
MYFRAIAITVTAASLAVAGSLAAQAALAPVIQLTGTQLSTSLLPVSYFPVSYSESPGTAYNSGSRLEHAPAKIDLYTYSCKKWLLGELPDSGFGETAYAGGTVGRLLGGWPQAYVQSVYQFASAARAAGYYRANYAMAARCRIVTAADGSKTEGVTTQSLRKGHVGGHQAFTALQTVTLTGGPKGINDTQVVLAGTYVFALDAYGTMVPTRPTPTAAMLSLIVRVEAAGAVLR